LIDLQINGGFGVDFSYDIVDAETAHKCVAIVAKGLLAHGWLLTVLLSFLSFVT
jgi:N-acetylglucosamine-6-phosphate deacetylase